MSRCDDQPIAQKLLNKVARAYDTLDFSINLKNLLADVFPEENFSQFTKYDLHRRINDLVISYYPGEEVIKYILFKTFYKKNNVAAFEIRVNNSRADFLCINGHSSSFEIKSGLDNLYKLPKQCLDYLMAFDFNYVVIDEKHLTKALDILPEEFGIWSVSGIRKKEHRKAGLNQKINPEIQLQLLTKKERKLGFQQTGGEIPMILKEISPLDINEGFKRLMKCRYAQRWNFIVSNVDTILPVDLQFFFNNNVYPRIIYHY